MTKIIITFANDDMLIIAKFVYWFIDDYIIYVDIKIVKIPKDKFRFINRGYFLRTKVSKHSFIFEYIRLPPVKEVVYVDNHRRDSHVYTFNGGGMASTYGHKPVY